MCVPVLNEDFSSGATPQSTAQDVLSGPAIKISNRQNRRIEQYVGEGAVKWLPSQWLARRSVARAYL